MGVGNILGNDLVKFKLKGNKKKKDLKKRKKMFSHHIAVYNFPTLKEK